MAESTESLEERKLKRQKEAAARKRRQKRLRRWTVFAVALLLFDAVLAVWLLWEPKLPELSVPTPTPTPGKGLVFTQEEADGTVQTTYRPVASLSSADPVPPGTGRYLALARADGYQVTPKEDVCYPEMTELLRDARAHQCRFVSGNGGFLRYYDYGTPVPESETVPESWFADAVFIGNSLEQGFMLYAGLDYGDIYATQSITLSNIYFQMVVDIDEETRLTILEAMGRKQYGKVFVMLGINEMSYATTGGFYDSYAALVDDIRELEPNAEVYLQAILPVTEEESESSSAFTNARIREFNDVIMQVAKDKEAHYLDIYEAMADESGCLPPGSSFDGIHPYSQYYPRWLTYLQSHTVTETKR